MNDCGWLACEYGKKALLKQSSKQFNRPDTQLSYYLLTVITLFLFNTLTLLTIIIVIFTCFIYGCLLQINKLQ